MVGGEGAATPPKNAASGAEATDGGAGEECRDRGRIGEAGVRAASGAEATEGGAGDGERVGTAERAWPTG